MNYTCPDPELLAAFICGTLSATELVLVTDHVPTCEACLGVLNVIAAIEREEQRAVTTPLRGTSRRKGPAGQSWWIAAAAA